MLTSFDQELTVTEHFQLGRFGQIVVSSGGRLPQPSTVAEPGAPARAVAAANALNRVIVDDALQNQNPDPILFGRGGLPLTAANTLRGGDTVTGLVGVMTYTWAGNNASPNAYRVRPINDLSDTVPGGGVPNFQPANPRPTAAPDVGGSLLIANFNVLNYFLTLNDGGDDCGPDGNKQECRGAETAIELDRQRTKLLAALAKLDSDIVGLIELENTPNVDPLGDIVAGLNARRWRRLRLHRHRHHRHRRDQGRDHLQARRRQPDRRLGDHRRERRSEVQHRPQPAVARPVVRRRRTPARS